MKTVSRKKQLEMMEVLACASGAGDYDEVRDEMFAAFDQEYGKGKWTFVPLTDEDRQEFEEWLASD